jgi:hypothetical protein
VKIPYGVADFQSLRTYRTALERNRGKTLRLRSYAVVALGFERLVVRSSVSAG